MTLFACAGQSGIKGLQENTQSFQQSIRWASLQSASALMDPHFKSDLMKYYGEWVEKNKTVEYTILGTQMNEAKNKADVWVEFSYYEIIHETLLRKRQKQIWAYNRDAKKWMITAVE